MAKKPVVKEIDNKTFEFYAMSPKESLKILTRLTKILGEPFGIIIDSAAKSGTGSLVKKILDGEIGGDAIGLAMRSLTERLHEDEVIDTCYLMLANVHGQFEGDKGTRKLQIDNDFRGELPLFLKIVAASLEVEYGSFLQGGFGGLITRSKMYPTDTKLGTEM